MAKLPFNSSFPCQKVREKFASYPEDVREKILFLRGFIFDIAKQDPDIGPIEETLKWGEPSYLPSSTKSGTTIRIDWKEKTPKHYYIYFNCKTQLIDLFKSLHGDLFKYVGNRSIVFELHQRLPLTELSQCLSMALRYHLDKKF